MARKSLPRTTAEALGPIDSVVFGKPEHVVHGPVKSKFGFHLVETKFRY